MAKLLNPPAPAAPVPPGRRDTPAPPGRSEMASIAFVGSWRRSPSGALAAERLFQSRKNDAAFGLSGALDEARACPSVCDPARCECCGATRPKCRRARVLTRVETRAFRLIPLALSPPIRAADASVEGLVRSRRLLVWNPVLEF